MPAPPRTPIADVASVAAKTQSYLPALDGIRALAVIAVLVYHARPSWLPGGFVGVEAFFVISGFIITRGLLAEWQATGRIGLRAFWWRRARRLLPALFVLLAVVVGYTAAFQPAELATLRGDTLSALTYVTNWRLIVDEQSYFEAFGRPSALRHLWSLAVEEQFYVVWPLVIAGGLKLLRRPLALVPLITAGAIGSLLAMALLYTPGEDASRVYYGTDTRASGLLFGAALAIAMGAAAGRPSRRPLRPGPSTQLGRAPAQAVARLLDLAGVAGIALLAGCVVFLEDQGAFLYRGGFALVGMGTGALIIAAVNHSTMISKLLSVWPLRWVGLRSYGIYLWHWPVLLLAWPQSATLPVLAGIGGTLALAALSYQLVERPARRIGAPRLPSKREAAAGPMVRRLRLTGLAVSAAGAFSLVVSLGVLLATARAAEEPPYLAQGAIRIVNDAASPVLTAVEEGASGSASGSSSLLSPALQQLASGSPIIDEAAAPEKAQAPEALSSLESAPPSASEPDEQIQAPAVSSAGPAPLSLPALVPVTVTGARVTAIGDSVMLGAAYQLAAVIPNIDLDALVGRQVSAAIGVLRQRLEAGVLGDVIVVGVGNNGTFSRAQFDEIMAIAGAERRVVFVNTKLPRSWEGPNNGVLADGVARYGNAALVDWHGVSVERDDFFWTDGIHLRPAGSTTFAHLIATNVQSAAVDLAGQQTPPPVSDVSPAQEAAPQALPGASGAPSLVPAPVPGSFFR